MRCNKLAIMNYMCDKPVLPVLMCLLLSLSVLFFCLLTVGVRLLLEFLHCAPVAVKPHQLPATLCFMLNTGKTCQHPKIHPCTHMKARPSKQRKTSDSINYWAEKGDGTVHVSSFVCCQRQETVRQRNTQAPSNEMDRGGRVENEKN